MCVSNQLLGNNNAGDPPSSLWESQDHFLLLDFPGMLSRLTFTLVPLTKHISEKSQVKALN